MDVISIQFFFFIVKSYSSIHRSVTLVQAQIWAAKAMAERWAQTEIKQTNLVDNWQEAQGQIPELRFLRTIISSLFDLLKE